MLRSLFTAISGLDAHQDMLDVTANNIANVNTVGYKSSSTVFQDALSQTLASTGANPQQIGLGVVLGGTNLNFGQGAPEQTGVPSNMMIAGNGFFAVVKNGQQLYTRAGSCTLDSSGHLVTPDGAQVEDVTGAPLTMPGLTNGTYVSYSIGSDGTVTGVDAAGATAVLGQVGLATFANPNGLSKVGDTEFAPTPSSGAASLGAPGTGGRGTIAGGYVEGSNVDLAQELTGLIVAERGFQANSKVVTTSDEVLQTLVNLKQ